MVVEHTARPPEAMPKEEPDTVSPLYILSSRLLAAG
jgi:hypothetical protein